MIYTILCRAAAFPMNRRGEPERPTRIVMTNRGDLPDDKWYKLFNDRLKPFNIQLDVDAHWKPSSLPSNHEHNTITANTTTTTNTHNGIDEMKMETPQFACHICSRTLPETSLRCAKCRAIRYCGRECQKTDWPNHRQLCTALQADRALTSTSLLTILSTLPDYYEKARLVNFNWYQFSDLIQLNPVWPFSIVYEASSSSLITSMDFNHLLHGEQAFSAPLLKSSGFNETPKAIGSWSDLYRAKGFSMDSPIALLIYRPLTLFYLLTSVGQTRPYRSLTNTRALSTAPGTYLCIHWVNATQAHVATSTCYELLTVLFPGITIDLFLVGASLADDPLIKKQDKPTPPPTREYKNERESSCIRVHRVPTTYSRFPGHQYKANLIILSEMTATNETLDDQWMSTIKASLSANGRLVILESTALGVRLLSEDIQKSTFNSWSAVFETVQLNPFMQPWPRQQPSLCVPSFSSGFIQAFVNDM
ncbi:hypothetical protein BDF22DRAFT_695243 [Syncephalis plumigaleata]|nr:hypothetical protein BDF22DRAFT_695243 [Syncephalis plumigaleata]